VHQRRQVAYARLGQPPPTARARVARFAPAGAGTPLMMAARLVATDAAGRRSNRGALQWPDRQPRALRPARCPLDEALALNLRPLRNA